MKAYGVDSKVLTDRAVTACFTGHRPEKFPKKLQTPQGVTKLYDELARQVDDAVMSGYHVFITGMARGVDTWGGLYVAKLKREHPELGLKLVCAVPFADEEKRRRGKDLEDFRTLVESADEVLYISQNYVHWGYQLRNEFMVDHSSLLMGIICRDEGGTANTVKYANKQQMRSSVMDIRNGFSMFGLMPHDFMDRD